MTKAFFSRELPVELKALAELALDMRWTWSHRGDALWRTLVPESWQQTENPWTILQDVSTERLEQLAQDASFVEELNRLAAERDAYLSEPACFQHLYPEETIRGIAYFSMEFGLGEALPLYAGGLGILAGDYLKTASDLGLPLIGIGLLYQEGYFRQMVDSTSRQLEFYPYNDPSSLPIEPVTSNGGGWLHVKLEFPGRTLLLRVWQVHVGRIKLYLLDSNDPLNAPVDRGITSKLYGGGHEMRMIQEIVLGLGGWRIIQELGLDIDICHLNEGHAAFVIFERARQFMEDNKVSFREALWATRAGNVFTTHTPVAAGFDRYPIELVDKYLPYFRLYLERLGISLDEILAMGRCSPTHDSREPFNMAYLAMRGCAWVNGVSRLHGAVSRRIFHDLYPGWPEAEVPVTHVTNGVHVPSWDSPWADQLWSNACGKARWMGETQELSDAINGINDEQLWTLCAGKRKDLVTYARKRLAIQLGRRGASTEQIAQAASCLDPNALIIGFARRFAEYKRPNLLLTEPERLKALLTNSQRPVQLLIAGKAHPQDQVGKRYIQEWVEFCNQPEVRQHAIFLEDYDITLAQQLVQGVDLWINTPRRPWEACGTSGMKVLVNGGLNLSELDGWWAEAYSPEYGWALGDGWEHEDADWDNQEARMLYELLENEIVPLFYQRDSTGMAQKWVARVRKSMADLTPRFSCNRMVHEYLDKLYLPAARAIAKRSAQQGRLAKELSALEGKLQHHWNNLHFGQLDVNETQSHWQFHVQVYLGDLAVSDISVELFADANENAEFACWPMIAAAKIAGAVNGYIYTAEVEKTRPAEHYTPRITASRSDVFVPSEIGLIHWQR